ncbi:MAG: hypothetical protein LBP26_02285 [Clostridiales bacterium]|jgi:hypothetical protein|nr:hypothetical protein [Clostridiales bacterium]
MDLSSILPLLMNAGANKSGAESGAGGGIADLLSAAATNNRGGGKNAALMSLLAGGGRPDIGQIMSLANMTKKSRPPSGLKAIKDVAPTDILGVMVRLFNK